jgi:hypothetical protein
MMQHRATPGPEDDHQHDSVRPTGPVPVNVVSVTVHTLHIDPSAEEWAWLRERPREEWAAQLTELAGITDSPIETALTSQTLDGAWREAVVGEDR